MPLALKEWDAVCEALGSGRQVIVIRTEDLAEPSLRGGGEFLLMPVFFHRQAECVVPEAGFAAPKRDDAEERDPLEIRHAATLVWSKPVTDRAALAKLQAFHILTSEEVEARFAQTPATGVEVALLRVYRLDPPQCVPWRKSFGEDGAWVEMEAHLLDACTRVSVLSDEHFSRLEHELLAILG